MGFHCKIIILSCVSAGNSQWLIGIYIIKIKLIFVDLPAMSALLLWKKPFKKNMKTTTATHSTINPRTEVIYQSRLASKKWTNFHHLCMSQHQDGGHALRTRGLMIKSGSFLIPVSWTQFVRNLMSTELNQRYEH